MRKFRRPVTLAVSVLMVQACLAPAAGAAVAEKPARKVGVCHRTASDSNPYTFITVSVNSTKKLAGHLMHRNDPSKWLHGRRDYIGVLDGKINSIKDCPNGGKPPTFPSKPSQKPDVTLPKIKVWPHRPNHKLPQVPMRPGWHRPPFFRPPSTGPAIVFPRVTFPRWVTLPSQIPPGQLGPDQFRPGTLPRFWLLRILRHFRLCTSAPAMAAQERRC